MWDSQYIQRYVDILKYFLVDPVDFSTIYYLEAKATLIITDSDGIQEVASFFVRQSYSNMTVPKE